MSGESVLEDTLFVHVEAAALIAHITSNSAPSTLHNSLVLKTMLMQ
jgi:hypothetical protein